MKEEEKILIKIHKRARQYYLHMCWKTKVSVCWVNSFLINIWNFKGYPDIMPKVSWWQNGKAFFPKSGISWFSR